MPSCLVEPFQSSQFQHLENLPDEPRQVMLLCRPGFESETGQEVQAVAQTCEVYGYVKTVEQSGQVAFVCYDTASALRLFQRLRCEVDHMCPTALVGWPPHVQGLQNAPSCQCGNR